MKIRIWVKCASNPAAAKHPSFISGQWGSAEAYRLKRKAVQARSLFLWLSQRQNLTDTTVKATLRHREDNNVEAPRRQQTKSPEKETHRIRWVGAKSETVPPPPHQQHLLYTSNEHQLPMHLSSAPFFRTKKTKTKWDFKKFVGCTSKLIWCREQLPLLLNQTHTFSPTCFLYTTPVF